MDKVKKFFKSYGTGIQLLSSIIKAITAVLGASVILIEGHPYLTLFILGLGALANEVLLFMEKENNNGKD